MPDQTEQPRQVGGGRAAITHLAFYAGWPKAMTAITVATQVFAG